MRLSKSVCLVAGILFGTAAANASGITFTCAANIDATVAGTCNYLNTTVAGNYNSTFTNANALIYIQYGTTGLASSTTGFYNFVTYAQYVGGLTAQATADGNAVQISAVAALAANDAAYSTDYVSVTSALASDLGIAADVSGGNTGITGPGGTACSDPGQPGCYNGIVTLSIAPSTWYYDQVGGSQAGLYDVYAAVEHETDEILGTSSCMSTQSTSLFDPCDAPSGDTGTPSDVDLFRYNSAGNLALNSSYIGLGSAPAGAYFSYNGGTTNAAGSKKYNTSANGDDYADFVATCPPTMSIGLNIQDATGCPGNDAGLTIKNDGGGEINILNAIGYDLPKSATPEPCTTALFGSGLALLAGAGYRRRHRA